jgi:peptidyl-prolyl cis-trans isomerase SurA
MKLFARTSWFAAGALMVAAFLPACHKSNPPAQEVWADVDGKPIYRADVERQYRSRMSTQADPSNPEQALSFKLNILNELINNQILVAHAERSGVSVSETEVDQKLAELGSPYSKEEFERKLTEQGLTREALRQEIRQSLLVTKLINKDISSRLSVSDAEIADFYQRNQSRFNVPETAYHLAQIEVTPVRTPDLRNLKNDDATNPAAAERKIQALYARLRAGNDFAKLAQEYSEDPRTSSGGGDMGFIPASSLEQDPPLKRAVQSIKVGEISDIIRTPSGYHIVKLLGREERGQRTLDDPAVKNAIRQSLMNGKEEMLRTAYIENLRNRAKVENFLAEQVVGAGGNPAASK